MYSAADGWNNDDSASLLIQGFAPAVYHVDLGGCGREFHRQGAGDNRSSGGTQDGTRDTY